MHLRIANDSLHTGLLQTEVEIANVGADGWVKLAPFGDFPGVSHLDPVKAKSAVEALRGAGVQVANDGTLQAVQRIDADSARLLVANATSLAGRALRFFRSIPIFAGHPDCAPIAGRYDDHAEKGVIRDLQAREDGLYALPAFNEGGFALVDGPQKISVSAYWDTQFIGADRGRAVVRPTRLRSVGLTSRPNLPVPMINSATGDNPNPDTMDIKLIVAALLAAGVTVPNDATAQQIADGVNQLATKAASAVAVANEKQTITTERDGLLRERDQLKVDVSNERAARRKDLIDLAIETGRITEAERADTERRLNLDFANESTALLKRAPVVKVTPASGTQGARAATSGADAQAQILGVVNEIQQREGISFEEAWNRSKSTHRGLHEALNQKPAA